MGFDSVIEGSCHVEGSYQVKGSLDAGVMGSVVMNLKMHYKARPHIAIKWVIFLQY